MRMSAYRSGKRDHNVHMITQIKDITLLEKSLYTVFAESSQISCQKL